MSTMLEHITSLGFPDENYLEMTGMLVIKHRACRIVIGQNAYFMPGTPSAVWRYEVVCKEMNTFSTHDEVIEVGIAVLQLIEQIDGAERFDPLNYPSMFNLTKAK